MSLSVWLLCICLIVCIIYYLQKIITLESKCKNLNKLLDKLERGRSGE